MPQQMVERLSKYTNSINPPMRDDMFTAEMDQLAHTFRTGITRAYQELCKRQTDQLVSTIRRAPTQRQEEAIPIAVRRLTKEDCPLENMEHLLRRPLLVAPWLETAKAPWLETTNSNSLPSTDDNSWAARSLRELSMDGDDDESLPDPPPP